MDQVILYCGGAVVCFFMLIYFICAGMWVPVGLAALLVPIHLLTAWFLLEDLVAEEDHAR